MDRVGKFKRVCNEIAPPRTFQEMKSKSVFKCVKLAVSSSPRLEQFCLFRAAERVVIVDTPPILFFISFILLLPLTRSSPVPLSFLPIASLVRQPRVVARERPRLFSFIHPFGGRVHSFIRLTLLCHAEIRVFCRDATRLGTFLPTVYVRNVIGPGDTITIFRVLDARRIR